MVRSSHTRAGLSYLEVLISASIALVGLLGAIAIIPLAARNIERGRIAETMIHVGESAIGRFQTEGFNDVTRWRAYNSNNVIAIRGIVAANDARYGEVKLNADNVAGANSYTGILAAEYQTGTTTFVNPARYYVTNRTAICFDPRMLAETPNTERGTGSEPDVELFPYVPLSRLARDARMLRVSAARSPGANLMFESFGAANAVRSNDDLVIFRPQNDPTIPGKQAFFGPPVMNGTQQVTDSITGESVVTPQFRDHLGEFEWIATLVPKPEQEGTATGEYILSIVVFQQRSRRLSPILLNKNNPAGATEFVEAERVLEASFLGDGYNGGDVRLSLRTGTTPARPTTDLQVAEGDWLMLCADPRNGQPIDSTTSQPKPYLGFLFQWYRVASAGDINGNQVDVTLQGPDWPAAQVPNPQAVILSNVVGVFERTIRVETNSQW